MLDILLNTFCIVFGALIIYWILLACIIATKEIFFK